MNKGFTLIELLIVIAITLAIAASAAPIYSNIGVSSQLNEANSEIIQVLRIARQRSVSGLNNSSHGVKFVTSSYTLYQGLSFSSRDSSYDRTEVLSDALTISTDFADDDINFSKRLGVPNSTGTIDLEHSVTGTRSIIVRDFGSVEKN